MLYFNVTRFRFFIPLLFIGLWLQACDNKAGGSASTKGSLQSETTEQAERSAPLSLEYQPGDEDFEKAFEQVKGSTQSDVDENMLDDLFEGADKKQEKMISVKPKFDFVEGELIPEPSGAEVKLRKSID